MPILEAVKWKPERRQAFAAWITHELLNTIGDRTVLDRKWSDEIVQWRAALPNTEKQFPWPGASNLVFPLTAMHADPVYADMMQTLHAPPEYWSITANRGDRVDHAHPTTEFLRRVESQFLHMRRVNSRALLDNNLLGTAIYKCHWLHERKKTRDYVKDASGGRSVQERTKIRSHPYIEHIPLQRFWIPADAWDIDPDAPIGGARWCAHELYFTRNALIQRAESETPFVPAFDKEAVRTVLSFEAEPENVVDDAIRRQEQFDPFHERRIKLYEVWARYDVDGDDIDEDVVCLVHRESNTVVRALYNPFLHGKRPFKRTRYLPTFGFYGLGMAEADRWAQLTATKLLNAIVDNAMIGNTQMFVAPMGSGVQPGEPIYPGKIWFVGPDEDVKTLPMGQLNPAIFQTLGNLLQYADTRVGVNDQRRGDFGGMPGRTPATSLLSIMREGNKRFDMILADFRDVHGEMGTMTLQNLAQWYQEDPTRWSLYCEQVVGPEDAQKVLELLTANVDDLEESFGVSVTATSALVNKEVEKQAFVGLMQIMTDVYSKLFETAQVLQNPQVLPGTPVYETAAAAYRSGVELMGQLLQKFDIQNPREYLGNLEAIAGTMQSMGAGINPAMAPTMMGAPGGVPMQSPSGFGQFNPSLLNPANMGSLLGL